jgi:DNA-directed RNA polymerase specialized sigma24 family protein
MPKEPKTQVDWQKELPLIKEIQNGDRQKFQQLYEMYHRRVSSLLYRHIPGHALEDVIQEAFVNVYVSIKSYSGKVPFWAWMKTLVIRLLERSKG